MLSVRHGLRGTPSTDGSGWESMTGFGRDRGSSHVRTPAVRIKSSRSSGDVAPAGKRARKEDAAFEMPKNCCALCGVKKGTQAGQKPPPPCEGRVV